MGTSSADPEPRVSIVIVAATQAERLRRCLEAVRREAPSEIPIEVVVVLNAAAPGLRAMLEQHAPEARIVESKVSLGFAGGANAGARVARGAFVHLLHDDTEVQPGWLHALLQRLAARPGAGAVSSMLLNFDGSLQATGWVLWGDGRTSAPWIGAPPHPDGIEEAFAVDYAPSASLIVRRELWDAIGGLDERFHPAYYVDVDLAMTIRSRGFVVLCEPASRVFHERGGSSTGGGFRDFLTRRNRAGFVQKWSRELAGLESYEAGQPALERALGATRSRAAALEAVPAPRVARPEPSAAQSTAARIAREHALLVRDVEVRAAYLRELEADAEHHRLKAERLEQALERGDAERAALGEQLESVRAAQRVLAGDRRRLIARSEALLEQLKRATAELVELRARSRTLAEVEAGRWWRLRTALLETRRRAGRISRRAASNRTE